VFFFLYRSRQHVPCLTTVLPSMTSIHPFIPPPDLSFYIPFYYVLSVRQSEYTPHSPSSPHARVCIALPSLIPHFTLGSSPRLQRSSPSIRAAVSPATSSSTTTTARLHPLSSVPFLSTSTSFLPPSLPPHLPSSPSPVLLSQSSSAFPFMNRHADFLQKPKRNILVQPAASKAVDAQGALHDPSPKVRISSPRVLLTFLRFRHFKFDLLPLVPIER
jgi:hypothetical protein